MVEGCTSFRISLELNHGRNQIHHNVLIVHLGIHGHKTNASEGTGIERHQTLRTVVRPGQERVSGLHAKLVDTRGNITHLRLHTISRMTTARETYHKRGVVHLHTFLAEFHSILIRIGFHSIHRRTNHRRSIAH